MIRQDYVLRLVEQLSQALGQILGFRKRGQYEAALGVLDQISRQFVGLSADSLLQLSADELSGLVAFDQSAEIAYEKCVLMATLLKQQGAICAEQGRVEASVDCYLKALHLLLVALMAGNQVPRPDYAPKVADLVADLDACIIPTATNLLLMQYYEQTGAYARAEDTLFEMLAGEPGNAELIAIGLAFYERLSRQSDEALVAGNFTRAEIEAGRAELHTDRG